MAETLRERVTREMREAIEAKRSRRFIADPSVVRFGPSGQDDLASAVEIALRYAEETTFNFNGWVKAEDRCEAAMQRAEAAEKALAERGHVANCGCRNCISHFHGEVCAGATKYCQPHWDERCAPQPAAGEESSDGK